MKIKPFFFLGCLGLGAFTGVADYSVSVRPGTYFMLANQLDHIDAQGAVNNRIPELIPNPPENTTLYPPVSGYNAYNYSADNPGWFPPTGALSPGSPMIMTVDPHQAPEPFMITFTGKTPTTVYPSRPLGRAWWSRQTPGFGTLENILGSAPCEGDWFLRLDPQGPLSWYGVPVIGFFYHMGKWSPYPPQLNLGEGTIILPGQSCTTNAVCSISGVAPPAACRGSNGTVVTVYGIGLPASAAQLELSRGPYTTGKLPAEPPDPSLVTNAVSARMEIPATAPAGLYAVRVFDSAGNLCVSLPNGFRVLPPICGQPHLSVQLLGRDGIGYLKQNQFALYYQNVGDAPAADATFAISCIPESSRVAVSLVSTNTVLVGPMESCSTGQSVTTVNPIPTIPPGSSGYIFLNLTSVSNVSETFSLTARSYCCGSASAQASDILQITTAVPQAPNDMVGVAGVGPARRISGADTLAYQIVFENSITSSVPVQQLDITTRLEPTKVDLATFAFGPMIISGQIVTPPKGVTSFSMDAVYDMDGNTNTLTDKVIVRISGSINMYLENFRSPTGFLSWNFRAIDPATGQPPLNRSLGFLPPNTTPSQGQGAVFFTVQPHFNLTTGETVTNSATIKLDGASVTTAIWTNTIDQTEPKLEIRKQGSQIQVSWSGSGTLQTATQLEGEWSDVPAARSPYSEAAPGQKFFRLRE